MNHNKKLFGLIPGKRHYSDLASAKTPFGEWRSPGEPAHTLFGGFGHYVAGGRGQAGSFELDCGVVDVEIVGRFFLDGGEDALTFVHVHVRNAGVQAKRVVTGAEGPDVDIVNFVHALDRKHGAGHIFDAAVVRATFEQNVGGLLKDADAGPKDEDADREAEERIDPAKAGRSDDDGANDDGDIGESVAEIVDQDAAQV